MIRLAIPFGPLAAGRQGVECDLALAVDAWRCLTVGEKLVLMNEVTERTGRTVELVGLRAVDEPLLGRILGNGKRLLGGGACTSFE